MKMEPRALADIQAYVCNLALWLIPENLDTNVIQPPAVVTANL